MKIIGSPPWKAAATVVVVAGSAVGTALNPWHERPRSFSRRFHSGMEEYFDPDLWEEVNNCPDCHQALGDRMYKKSDVPGYYEPGIGARKNDSHCPKHWKKVRNHQHHTQMRSR